MGPDWDSQLLAKRPAAQWIEIALSVFPEKYSDSANTQRASILLCLRATQPLRNRGHSCGAVLTDTFSVC